jgi:hypothetical protein
MIDVPVEIDTLVSDSVLTEEPDFDGTTLEEFVRALKTIHQK